jgi:hypothetical protein
MGAFAPILFDHKNETLALRFAPAYLFSSSTSQLRHQLGRAARAHRARGG